MAGPSETKRRALPWITVAALIALGAGGVVYLRRADPPIEVKTVRVERGEVREMVSSAAAGEVKPARRVTVRAELAGTVSMVLKKQGDRVEAGELLVGFTSDELDARLSQAQANVDASRVAVKMAETRLQTAKRALDRAKKLRASESISEVDLDRTQTEHDALAQGIDQGRAAEKQALAALRLAEVTKKRASIHTPFAGVLQSVSAEVGVQLAPASPLFDLIDDSAVYVEIPVDEADVGRIFVGQKVTLRSDSQRAPLNGTVTLIPPAVGRPNSLGPLDTPMMMAKERSLYVQVTPDEPKVMRVGSSVNAEFLVSSRLDVLFVPSHVVLGRGVTRSVYRVEQAKAVKVSFKAGLTAWDRTEVLSALNVDDEIISSLNIKALEDGFRVFVQP